MTADSVCRDVTAYLEDSILIMKLNASLDKYLRRKFLAYI